VYGSGQTKGDKKKRYTRALQLHRCGFWRSDQGADNLGGRISSHGVFWELLCGDLRVRVRKRRRNRVVKRRRRRKTRRN
jgi:hypothetical protein